MSKPFAVRITVAMSDGSTATQPYVRSERSSQGREVFTSMALGRMLRMLSDWDDTRGLGVTGWSIVEIDPATVA